MGIDSAYENKIKLDGYSPAKSKPLIYIWDFPESVPFGVAGWI